MEQTVTDAIPVSSTGTSDPTNVEEAKPVDGSTPASGEQPVPWHQDKRWQEFIQNRKEYQQYQQLGSPAEVSQALSRLQYLDKLIAEAESESVSQTKQEAAEQDQLEQARKELLKLFPGLAKMERQLAMFEQREQLEVAARATEARDELTEVLDKAGIEATKTNVAKYEEALTGIIGADPKLSLLFRKDPQKAVRAAWKELNEPIEKLAARRQEAEVQRNKEPIKGLPKTHGPGGTPEGKEPPQAGGGLKGATDRVKARLEKAGA